MCEDSQPSRIRAFVSSDTMTELWLYIQYNYRILPCVANVSHWDYWLKDLWNDFFFLLL